MRTLLYFLIPFIAFAACKKNTSNVVQPNTTNTPFYTKMNGNWIWMGGSRDAGPATPWKDAFLQYPVLATNDSIILVGGSTFTYISFDSISQVYKYEYNSYTPYNYTYLYYSARNGTIDITWSNKNSDGYHSTKQYKPNNSLKDYIPNIVGPKTLSGTVYDTSFYPPADTLYTIDTTINFIAVNDSTIVADKRFLFIDNDTLHYKLTDAIAKTVVFQTFHYSGVFSTLTYNYETKSLIFEQEGGFEHGIRHLKLE